MIHVLAQNIDWIIEPAAIVDDASFTTASVDTRGFSHCSIYARLGAIDNTSAFTVFRVDESDDDSSYTQITGLIAAGTTGSGRLPQGTDDNKTFAFHVDLRGRKRYLDLIATIAAGTGGFMVAYAVLSRGKEAPNTPAERGLEWELRLPV